MGRGLRIVSSIILYIFVNILIAAIIGVSIGLYGVCSGMPQSEFRIMIDNNLISLVLIVHLLSFLMYTLIFLIKKESLIKQCCFKKLSNTSLVYMTLIAIGLSFLACSLSSLFQGNAVAYNHILKNISGKCYTIIAVLLLTLIIPLFEEILFRALIFIELRRALNFEISALIQAIIFGVYHGNLIQGIYIFLLGLMLCFVYEGTGSIWSNVYMNCVFKILGIVIVPIIVNNTSGFQWVYVVLGTALVIFSAYKLYVIMDIPKRKMLQGFKPEYFDQ
ncbi:MAG: type II CAAX endopeptidase family protein [Clostridium sp.]